MDPVDEDKDESEKRTPGVAFSEPLVILRKREQDNCENIHLSQTTITGTDLVQNSNWESVEKVNPPVPIDLVDTGSTETVNFLMSSGSISRRGRGLLPGSTNKARKKKAILIPKRTP